MPLFVFDVDLDDGVYMTYEVLGESEEGAKWELVALLQSGKICDVDNPYTNIVTVTRTDSEGEHLICKMF